METILAAAMPFILKASGNLGWMVLCVYFEARSEPIEDQVAVCQVIMNRVIKRDCSAEEIIKRPYQFSWLNEPERDLIIDDFDSLNRAFAAVEICSKLRMDGKDLFGADHYFARYIKKPRWAEKMTLVWSGKTHDYYRE